MAFPIERALIRQFRAWLDGARLPLNAGRQATKICRVRTDGPCTAL